MIALDYSECDEYGEPCVAYIDQTANFYKTIIARDFESFIKGLMTYGEYEEFAKD